MPKRASRRQAARGRASRSRHIYIACPHDSFAVKLPHSSRPHALPASSGRATRALLCTQAAKRREDRYLHYTPPSQGHDISFSRLPLGLETICWATAAGAHAMATRRQSPRCLRMTMRISRRSHFGQGAQVRRPPHCVRPQLRRHIRAFTIGHVASRPGIIISPISRRRRRYRSFIASQT